jgi:hypothetical protein
MFSTKSLVVGVGMALAVVALPVTRGRSFAQPAADEIAVNAFAVLETNCANAGCHAGPGHYSFDVKEPPTLRAAKVIQAGNADDSEIIRRVESGAMPLGGYKGQVGTKLPAADIAILRRWIDAGAPAPAVVAPIAQARPFISERQLLKAIQRDLQAAPPRDRSFLRYFSFAHVWNRTDVPEVDLAAYPLALSKLVHHLSWERAITQPKSVGTETALLRIDVRDYGWTKSTWNQIASVYPYGLTDASLLAQADDIEALSETSVPYIRADWFVANASIAPLYHEILRLPDTLKGLEGLLRIDSAADVELGRARRFGLRNSAVSRNNRAIERSPTAYGAYWKSFDFASSRLEQNIFVDPVNLHPDGGEVIFSLPNGLQGYFIIDRNGRRIDDAPVAIVRDRANTEDPVVHNGRSCIGCHTQGLNAFRDEISGALRARVDATFDLSRAESLYRGQEELDHFLNDDNRLFKDALLRIGGGHTDSGGDPINRLSRRHEAPLSVAQAAADLYLDAASLQQLIVNSADLRAQGFDQLLLPGGGIKRDTWEQGFRILLREKEARVTDSLVQGLPTIALNTNLGPGATRHLGERLVISVTASTESFVGVVRVDSRGNLRQVYPIVKGPQPRVGASQTIRLVDSTEVPNGVFGVETLIAVASADPIPLESQSGWEMFAGTVRTWAASSSPPKRVGNKEIAVLRFFTSP